MPVLFRFTIAALAAGIGACGSQTNGHDTAAPPRSDSRAAATQVRASTSYGLAQTAQSRRNHRLRLLMHNRWRKLYRVAGTGPFYRARTLDLDDDNDEDLIVSYSLNPQGSVEEYRVLETVIFRNSGEDFTMEGTGVKVQINDATVADFNGDQLEDVFVADTGPDAEPFSGGLSRLFLQTVDGKLRDVTQANVPKLIAFTHAACSGDYDSDGDQDLFLAIVNKQHVLWENDGSGRFTDATETKFPAELGDNGEDPAVSFQWCETGDFNADGRDDLVLGQQDIGRPEEFIIDNNNVVLLDSHVVLYGDPDGKLVTDYSIGLLPVEWDQAGDRPQVVDMRAADFDQNDCLDLLVASTNSGTRTTSNFAIYFGDCAGAFSPAVDYSVSPSVESAHTIHITDFNRDGYPDFVPHYLFDPNPDGGLEVRPVDFRYYESRAYIFTRSLREPFTPRPLMLWEVEQLPLLPFHGLYHSELPGYTAPNK